MKGERSSRCTVRLALFLLFCACLFGAAQPTESDGGQDHGHYYYEDDEDRALEYMKYQFEECCYKHKYQEEQLKSDITGIIRDPRCTTCEFTVGRGVGAIDFSAAEAGGLLAPVSLSRMLAFENNRDMTIEMWVYTHRASQFGLYQPIVSRYPRGPSIRGNIHAEFNLQLQPSGNLNFFMGGGPKFRGLGMNLNCGPVIKDKTWHHVALVFYTPPFNLNPHFLGIYVDSKLVCRFERNNKTVNPAYFRGDRQFLVDEPLAFSNYENLNAAGLPQSWDGYMDEIRIWNVARTAEEIAATWNVSIQGCERNLFAYYKLNRVPTGLPNGVWDDGPFDQQATLLGYNGQRPAYIGSLAPIQNKVFTTNFGSPIPLIFYAWTENFFDQFVVLISNSSFEGQLFLDPAGTEPFFPGDSAPTPAAFGVRPEIGQPYPQARLWFVSTAQTNTTTIIQYYAGSLGPGGVPVYSSQTVDNALIPIFADVQIVVTANGCNGKGGVVDYCGNCGGDGSQCPPLGCDQRGGSYDICGVCNAFGVVPVLSCPIGCDGVAFSNQNYDSCGVCGGDNACVGGCDQLPFSTKEFDLCGVCGGNNACIGCNGVVNSGLVYDACGVCNGTNTCLGCDGIPFSGVKLDRCDVCGGNGLSCTNCTLAEWRDVNQAGLDSALLHEDLAILRGSLLEASVKLDALIFTLAEDPPHGDASCNDFTAALHDLSSFTVEAQAFMLGLAGFDGELLPNLNATTTTC